MTHRTILSLSPGDGRSLAPYPYLGPQLPLGGLLGPSQGILVG